MWQRWKIGCGGSCEEAAMQREEEAMQGAEETTS